MAIHQVRLPDTAGTPRLVIAETPTSAAPPTPGAGEPAAPAAPPLPETHAPAPHWRDAIAPPVPADDPRPWYRAEAWLAVEFASVVPVVVALIAPEGFRLWLVGLAGAMIALGLAMLVRRDREARRAQPRTHPSR